MDWDSILEQRVRPPFIPKIKSKTKPRYFDEEFTTLPVNSPKMGTKNMKKIDANWNQNFPDYASFN